jgi:hypothetical protein
MSASEVKLKVPVDWPVPSAEKLLVGVTPG